MTLSTDLIEIQETLSFLLLKDGIIFVNARLSMRLNQSSFTLLSMNWDFNEGCKYENINPRYINQDIDTFLINTLLDKGLIPTDIELSIFVGKFDISQITKWKFRKVHNSVFIHKNKIDNIPVNIQILTF